jgi:carbonic anhydrase
MTVVETLTQRNEAFASSRFSADLKIMPSMKTMIIGCVDPSVDPADIFGLLPGEAVVIRNVGVESPRQRSRQWRCCASSPKPGAMIIKTRADGRRILIPCPVNDF